MMTTAVAKNSNLLETFGVRPSNELDNFYEGQSSNTRQNLRESLKNFDALSKQLALIQKPGKKNQSRRWMSLLEPVDSEIESAQVTMGQLVKMLEASFHPREFEKELAGDSWRILNVFSKAKLVEVKDEASADLTLGEEIQSFKDLERGWDGANAFEISSDVCDEAEVLAEGLVSYFEDVDASPGVDGSVGIEGHSNSKFSLYLNIDDDLHIAFVFVEKLPENEEIVHQGRGIKADGKIPDSILQLIKSIE